MDVPPRNAGFGEMYGGHSRAVYRFALGLSGNAAEAGDLTAEAFLRIWEAGERVQLGSVRAYLLTIVRNLHRQQWRRERRRGEMPDVVAGGSGTGHTGRIAGGAGGTPGSAGGGSRRAAAACGA